MTRLDWRATKMQAADRDPVTDPGRPGLGLERSGGGLLALAHAGRRDGNELALPKSPEQRFDPATNPHAYQSSDDERPDDGVKP
jgi:hypothetical protein